MKWQSCQRLCSWTLLNSDIQVCTKAELYEKAPHKSTTPPVFKKHTVHLKWYLKANRTPERLKRNVLYKDFDLDFFHFLKTTLLSFCRWRRSGPRQEQVRCTGLWHSAEGGPEVPAPLTAQCPWLASLSELQQHPSDYTALPSDRPLSTSMQGNLAKCLHFYHWNKVTIRTLFF